jgi:uncharacterized protein (TIGR02118 family)
MISGERGLAEKGLAHRMFKIIALTRFPPNLTVEYARQYWTNVHGPLALLNPLIRRYLQDHWITPLDGGELVFHGNSEIWYDDEDDYVTTMQSAEWATLVDDGPNVFDYSTIVSGVVDEHVLRADNLVGTGHKVMWMLELAGDAESARSYWLEQHAPLVLAVPGVRRYEQNHATRSADVRGLTADEPPFEGRLDGLFSLWFDDTAACDAALASPEWAAVLADTERFVRPGSLVGTVIHEHVKR